MATVRLSAEAQEHVRALPVTIKRRVDKVLERLKQWPDVPAKPLRGDMFGQYRIRTGDWRVVFRPVGDVVLVTSIANRRDVYDD